jgi:hypothetical protein
LILLPPTGKNDSDFANALRLLGSDGVGRGKFVSDIKADLAKAQTCAERGGLHFDDPLKAVYHYRKHGADFPDVIRRGGNSVEVYLGPVRDQLFEAKNLRETCTLSVGLKSLFILI